jgi:hypothetical protein
MIVRTRSHLDFALPVNLPVFPIFLTHGPWLAGAVNPGTYHHSSDRRDTLGALTDESLIASSTTVLQIPVACLKKSWRRKNAPRIRARINPLTRVFGRF